MKKTLIIIPIIVIFSAVIIVAYKFYYLPYAGALKAVNSYNDILKMDNNQFDSTVLVGDINKSTFLYTQRIPRAQFKSYILKEMGFSPILPQNLPDNLYWGDASFEKSYYLMLAVGQKNNERERIDITAYVKQRKSEGATDEVIEKEIENKIKSSGSLYDLNKKYPYVFIAETDSKTKEIDDYLTSKLTDKKEVNLNGVNYYSGQTLSPSGEVDRNIVIINSNNIWAIIFSAGKAKEYFTLNKLFEIAKTLK